ncbi:F-box only protein 39 [Biomphalaria glabrata]|nr:F-box only protein 39 [Biomphalaria glabrata]
MITRTGLTSKFTQSTAEERKVTDMQTKKQVSLSSLPMEILEHIFSFMHRDDLLQAMSVCTSWQSLIYNSPNLWTKQTFILDCALHANKKKKVEMFFCAHNFGPHFRTLTVDCRHPYWHNCREMANKFNLFVSGLRAPALTSFIVSDLHLDSASRIVINKISKTLTQMFTMVCHLKVFEMPAAHWPKALGRELLDTVFQKSRNTLETLDISDYFIFQNGIPVSWDWFSTGLTSLTKITKLSITIYHLTDEIVLSLARTRRGQLTHLFLMANYIFENSVKRDSWIYLRNACPKMAVEITIDGFVYEPHEAIPYFIEPLELPVGVLNMTLTKGCHPRTMSVTEMEIALDYVSSHYCQSLKNFTLGVYNKKDENFDQSLIKLVRDCPFLFNVKVSAFFNSGDSAKTIDKIVADRLPPLLTSTAPENKYVHIEDYSFQFQDRLELFLH